jgi:hypothetical protein
MVYALPEEVVVRIRHLNSHQVRTTQSVGSIWDPSHHQRLGNVGLDVEDSTKPAQHRGDSGISLGGPVG